MNLTPQQLGTVMAALRYWQKDIDENEGDYPGDFWDIAADGGAFEPLNVDEIDALCEDINCGAPYERPTGGVVRLFNEYSSAAGNAHADRLDVLARDFFNDVEKYITEHNICPRDAHGWISSGFSNHMAAYTIKRAIKLKKRNDAGQ